MRNFIWVILLLCFTNPDLLAQSKLTRSIKEYYRVDPFEGSFSAFVKALMTDPSLLKKEMALETDTTDFYIKGEYQVFNPYSINANKIEVYFYKGWDDEARDRIGPYYIYRITGYFPDSKLTRDKVLREYKELVKQIKKEYVYTEKEDLAGRNQIEAGEILSFYHKYKFPTATSVVSWQTLPVSRQVALSFVVRLKQHQNRLYPFRPPTYF